MTSARRSWRRGIVAISDRPVLARCGEIAMDQRRNRDVQAHPARRLRARRDRKWRAVRQRHPRARGRGMLSAGAAPEIRPSREADGQAGRAARRGPARERRRPATGFPQAGCGHARDRARRPRPARSDAASAAAGMARRRLPRRDGGHQRAGDHRDSGTRRGARPTPRSRGIDRLHARRSQGQARTDRQTGRARRGRRQGARLLSEAGHVQAVGRGALATLARA